MDETRTIAVSEDAMPMALYFSDADPVAQCLVTLQHAPPIEHKGRMVLQRCGWRGHGDSMSDAVTAWTGHLAADHKLDWPDPE